MGGPWEKYAQASPAQASGPWTKYQQAQPDDSGVDPNAVVQGFGNMAVAGYIPEITGLVGKMLPDPDASADAKLKAQGFNIQQPKFQGETTDQSRAMQAQMAKDSPVSYYGGGIAGAVATAPAYGAGMKVLGIAKDVAPIAAAEDAGLLEKAGVAAKNLGAKAVQAGKEGAALGLVANPNTQVGDNGLNIGGRISNAVVGGALSSAVPGVTGTVKGAYRRAVGAGESMAVKALSNLGGVKPDVINEYLQFSDRINKAPNVDALKEVSDQFVGKLADDVEAKKITAEQAKAAYNGFQSDLKDAYRTAGYDSRDAVTSAKETLKDAHSARIQQLSGDLYDTVNQLKSDVQAGSKKALETLNNSTAKVDLAPVYSTIDQSIDRLKQDGTDESLAIADKLQAYKERLLSKNWSKIAPQDAKRLIQGLDQITEYDPMAGAFDKAKNAAFKGIRSSLDKSVKDAVPEYRQAMLPVATDADLLSRVQDFGDKQTAAGILGRIDSPTQMDRAQALKELGEKYGVDFIGAANPENLPEQKLLNEALAKQESLRPDRVSEKIDQRLANSREKAAMDAANADLNTAQDKLSPFKSLAPNSAGQTNAQSKLEQLGKGKNIELTDMFRKLSSLTGTDFVQAMKDQNTLAAFKKGATNGSRNTVMGAVAGWLFGGPLGMGTGVAVGRSVDQWGPAITKKVLDGAINVAKNPTVATISKLDLPEPVKRNMMIGLENYLAKGGQIGSQLAEQASARVASSDQPPNRMPARGPAAWAQSGVQKLGIQDQNLIEKLMQDPKGKQLLIQASDLKPGSKAMKGIMTQIQTRFGGK